jgi:hypothetical protein
MPVLIQSPVASSPDRQRDLPHQRTVHPFNRLTAKYMQRHASEVPEVGYISATD